jgi:hypothetical protein
VRHVAAGQGSKGAGESMELADIVSKSGVQGSKYGFVVLMKVTETGKPRINGVPRFDIPFRGISIQMVSSSKVFLYA